MSISSSAMLVEMNISVWTAAIVDRKTTDKVTLDAHAVADAGKFRKNLMAGTSLRKDIADYAALCRTWHNGRTLPWSDKGVRLLPTSMFLEYKREADARAAYFNSKVSKFVAEYPDLIVTAQTCLGDLFDGANYPSAEEVASKFGFRMVFSPVPEVGDFRLDINNDELAHLRNQYETAYTDRVGDAMKTTWDKLHTTLLTMSEKLTEPQGEETKQFRSTFVTNAQEMCQLLSHLNITKDPQLEEARRALELTMLGADIEEIKEDSLVRAEMKSKIDNILGKFNW
jgi:hypothetical protein